MKLGSQPCSLRALFALPSLEQVSFLYSAHIFQARVFASFFSEFILAPLFPALLPRGAAPSRASWWQDYCSDYCYSDRDSEIDTPPGRRISEKLLKRIPPRRSSVDRWNSQMLARYTARRKYVSLSRF